MKVVSEIVVAVASCFLGNQKKSKQGTHRWAPRYSTESKGRGKPSGTRIHFHFVLFKHTVSPAIPTQDLYYAAREIDPHQPTHYLSDLVFPNDYRRVKAPTANLPHDIYESPIAMKQIGNAEIHTVGVQEWPGNGSVIYHAPASGNAYKTCCTIALTTPAAPTLFLQHDATKGK